MRWRSRAASWCLAVSPGGYKDDSAVARFCVPTHYKERMHPFLVFSLAVLTCSTAVLLAHTTKPFLLCFDGPTAGSLLRRTLPAVGLMGRLFKRSGISDLAARCLHWADLASSLTREATPSHARPSPRRQPSSTEDVRRETSPYGWLWLRTRRVLVKASLNVLRQQIRALSLPSWALGLSVRRNPATLSGLTTVVFAVGPSQLHYSSSSRLTENRAASLLGCSLCPCPA